MDGVWQILRDGGLPLVAPATGTRRSAGELATAIRAAIAGSPSGREADALSAFVLAWHHHWPASFAEGLGAEAPSVIAWASHNIGDANRYLKLRRIAIENLSTVL